MRLFILRPMCDCFTCSWYRDVSSAIIALQQQPVVIATANQMSYDATDAPLDSSASMDATDR